jgi:hypothetical protein
MESKEDPESSPTIETVEDHSKSVNLAGKDRAAEFLSNASERVVVSEADNKRILRKIDLMVLPIMLGAYFLQQLDKSALSYSSVFGLVKDAHLVGEDYSWLGSIVYVAQLVMQPLVAYFLVKLPTGKFAGGMILSWGIVLTCMSQAKNFKGLMAARFFLGGFEAAIGRCPERMSDSLLISHSSYVCRHYSDVVEEKRTNKQNRSLVRYEWSHHDGMYIDMESLQR